MARDWKRLGEYVRRRRYDELHLTQQDVQSRGGPSTATQRSIEGGKKLNYHPQKLHDLEDVLGWERDSCLAIADGRQARLKVAVTLGRLLVDRRLWLGGLDRDLWCAQQQPPVDPQLAYDIEHGLRASYNLRELTHLNQAYRLKSGAIRNYLSGEVTELAVTSIPVPVPQAEPPASGRQMEALARSAMENAGPWIEQILAEVDANGGTPRFRNAQEQANWEALAAAGQPLEELVADAAWWRLRDSLESAAPPLPRGLPRRAEETA